MTAAPRLLAATDLSAPARHAAGRAALIARQLGGELDLQHVISASPVDRLRRLLVEAPADLAACVVEQEQERGCNLIVAGRHGASPLEAFLLGSVTRHVLRESQGDVLVSLAPPLLDGPIG